MVYLREIKRSGRSYFYLEHTIREGSNFRNRREYLGTSLPNEMDRRKEDYFNSLVLEQHGRKLEGIKKGYGKELAQYPESAKASHIESFMIRFTYNTNRIEGSTLTLKETADLLQESITPRNKPMRDVKETESHKKVFYLMLDYGQELNLATVLFWHKMLFKDSNEDIAGRIRSHPVSIARSKAQLALPAEMDTCLHDFFSWYRRQKNTLNPVVLAALVHLKFVTIHPFSDGNGRISRLLMNFVLHKHGFPMLTIDYTNRNAYYNALERSQVNKKDEIFIQYLVKRYIKEYQRFLK
jgi:Fic family protein